MDSDQSRLVKSVTHCRVCGHELVNWILNFGSMPLANRYPANIEEKDFYAPLEVMMCLNCGCVQLRHTVDPKILYEDYLYTSSTSGSLAEYFRQYAQDTVDKLGWKPGDEKSIVGIGGNDGVLEKAYQSLGFKVLNMEPAANIAELSRANGVETVTDFFNEQTAELVDFFKDEEVDLITCNHCFAHMHNIHDVVKGIKLLLKPGGTFIFEESYWPDMVAGNHFDQIYHEHVFYWTIRALEGLFFEHGMRITSVERNSSQGGSIRGYVQHGNVSTGIADLLIGEQRGGLFDLSTYEDWNRRIFEWRTKCRAFLELLKSISCYGAPAKFAMISDQLGLGNLSCITGTRISYVVEDSPIKILRYTPGARIPILDRAHFIHHPTDHCIITAANYADLIVKNNPQYKGKWIVLNPEPRFYEK